MYIFCIFKKLLFSLQNLCSVMNSFMSKVLELSERHGFIIPVIANGVVDHLRYGPLGELLAQNIFHEWIYSNVTNRDHNVYLYHSENRSDDIRGM